MNPPKLDTHNLAIYGLEVKPHLISRIWHDRAMKKTTIKERIAITLDTWMRQTPGLESQPKLAKKSGVGQTTIGRILRAEVDPGAEKLDLIARAFGKTASDLMAGISLVYEADKKSYPAPAATVNYIPKISLQQVLTCIEGPGTSTDRAASLDGTVEFHCCPVDCSRQAFILELADSRMNDGSDRAYHAGDWVYVDPEEAAAPGDDVIAMVGGEVQIGRLSGTPDNLVIETLNPRWPNGITPVKAEDIAGKVIFSGRTR